MEKNLKDIQTFEQYTDKNLNISDVSESKNYAWISSIIRKDIDDIEKYIKDNTNDLEFIKKIDKIKRFVYDHTK